MASLWQKIGLTEPDKPETPPPTAEKVPAGALVTEAPGAPKPIKVPVTPSWSAGVDPQQKTKYLGVLNQALQEADIPGPDFLEFMNGLRGLAAVAIPEDAKFSTAVTMISAQGVTPQKLIDTAGHYITALEKNEDEFSVYVQGERETRVVKVQLQAEEALKTIQMKAEQVAQLQQEMAELNAQSTELKQSAAIAESEITSKVAAFQEAKSMITAEINGILTRLTAIVNIPK